MSITDTRQSFETFKPKKVDETKENKKLKIDLYSYSHLRTTNNRIMVKVIPIDYSVSKGGISLGNNVKTTFLQGVVVSVGDGVLVGTTPENVDFIQPKYEVGDVVYFSDMAGVDFKLYRGEHEYEGIKIIDCDSIYFVDPSAIALYEKA